MTAQIIDGKRLASEIKDNIASRVDRLLNRNIQPPCLAVILIGEDPASSSYVNAKRKACEYVGFTSCTHNLPYDTKESELVSLIDSLNHNTRINGILVQLPLPPHINREVVIERISPEKDVDGFHPYNLGRLCQRCPTLKPCTPKGVMRLLETTAETVCGKDAIVIGASEIVGRPMALELLLAGSTVTIAHRFTKNLKEKVSFADIVVVATGKPNLVKGHWIKEGATVIDVGITRMDDGSLVGDVEFETAKERASWITPVPGGVGPMTVACLMENTLEACLAQNNIVR